MSAPERIWAELPEVFDDMGFWQEKPRAGLTEYVRLDPNTRVVTVAQLELWSWAIPEKFKSHKEIRAIIGEVL